LRRQQLYNHSRNSQHFMELRGGGLPHSQEFSTCPHLKPEHSFLILSPIYILVFLLLMVYFLLAFPSITYMHSSSPHSCYMPHLVLGLIILIILGKEYKLLSPSLCSFLHPHHVIPLQSKYSLQLYSKLMYPIQFYSNLVFLDHPNGIF
jgi:hypothetical protein